MDPRDALAFTWVESVATSRPLASPISTHCCATRSNNRRNTFSRAVKLCCDPVLVHLSLFLNTSGKRCCPCIAPRFGVLRGSHTDSPRADTSPESQDRLLGGHTSGCINEPFPHRRRTNPASLLLSATDDLSAQNPQLLSYGLVERAYFTSFNSMSGPSFLFCLPPPRRCGRILAERGDET